MTLPLAPVGLIPRTFDYAAEIFPEVGGREAINWYTYIGSTWIEGNIPPEWRCFHGATHRTNNVADGFRRSF